jgi:hypothetical protein
MKKWIRDDGGGSNRVGADVPCCADCGALASFRGDVGFRISAN